MAAAYDVAVAEGFTAPVGIKLSEAPSADVTVTVVRAAGDPDLAVVSGTSLIFTAANWDAYQPATVRAAADADALDGSTVVRATAPGWRGRNVTFVEDDAQGGSLSNAVDNASREWACEWDAEWFYQRAVTHDGEDAAQSGAIGDGRRSVLTTTVTGPGVLSFWWSVSSEAEYDFLEFFCGPEVVDAISGESGWVEMTLEIGPGDHALRWVYRKDASVSAGADSGRVDQVRYTRFYSVTAVASQAEGGTVTGGGRFDEGALAVVQAEAAGGWRFVRWMEAGGEVSGEASYGFSVTGDRDLVAEFERITHILTYEAGPNGAIAGMAVQTVEHGANGTLVEAVPAAGYHFAGWSDGSTANPRTEAQVAGPLGVTANFAINSYSLSYAAGAHGSLEGATAQTVEHGANGTPIEAVPATGYHFVNWSDGSTANPRTETNVTESLDVTAGFATNIYPVIFDLGAHGMLTGGGSLTQSVAHGAAADEPVFVVEPHWRFTGWDGLFDSVTGPLTVVAQFERITHGVTVVANPPAGGVVTGGGTYYESDIASVRAVRNFGWRFVGWTVGGTEVNLQTAFDFEVVGPRDLVAEFEPLTLTVGPTTAEVGMSGTSYTVTVTANTGWSVTADPTWASVTPISGSGTGTATVTLAENLNALARTGTVEITGVEVAAPAVHRITQQGGSVALRGVEAGFARPGGNGTVEVVASHLGLGWTATSDAPWLHVTAGATGTGNGRVAFAADPNPGTTARQGTLTIGNQVFTVVQGGPVPLGDLLVHVDGPGTLTGATPEVPAAKPLGGQVVLTARPACGQRFKGWTGTGLVFPPGGERSATLSFAMGSDVDLTAHFEPADFAAAGAGDYAGLAAGTDGSDLSTNGLCSVTVTRTGAFTCSVQTAAGKYSGAGAFTADNTAAVVVRQAGRDPILLAFELDPLGQWLAVEARSGGAIGPVLWTADAAKCYVPPAGGSHPGTGYYTALLRPDLAPGATTGFGTGYAAVTIGRTGAVSAVGALPDGTRLSAGGRFGVDAVWPMFAPLYEAGGFIGGEVALAVPAAPGAATLDSATAGLRWVKKALVGRWRDRYYRGGFDVPVEFKGGKYTPPARGATALQVPLPLAPNNVQFAATGGGLATDPPTRLTLDASNRITVTSALPADPARLTLTLNTGTGLVTARFLDGVGRAARIVLATGLLSQRENAVGGVFLGPPAPGLGEAGGFGLAPTPAP